MAAADSSIERDMQLTDPFGIRVCQDKARETCRTVFVYK